MEQLHYAVQPQRPFNCKVSSFRSTSPIRPPDAPLRGPFAQHFGSEITLLHVVQRISVAPFPEIPPYLNYVEADFEDVACGPAPGPVFVVREKQHELF